MKDPDKTKSIDQSLEDSTKAIDLLKESSRSEFEKLPKQTLVVEDRLSSIQGELDSISDKMLAYKLQRIAGSKMLEAVSSYAKSGISEDPGAPSPASGVAKIYNGEKPVRAKNNKLAAKKIATYESTTFRCKSDLDTCLLSSANALDKALCFALFIRCAIKG